MRALILVLLAGCMAPTRSADEARYLALGDSYTIGEGVDAEARWPAVLAARLRSEGTALGQPTIIATTGWTTDELDAAIDDAERAGTVSGNYDLVTLLIGVNNQYRGREAEEYRTEFRSLLARAIAFAGARPDAVVVLSIPDWGVTAFAQDAAASDPRRAGPVVAREIDAYNAVAREEVRRAGARWVDVTALSRAHPDELTSDGLHPSAAQYARWAEAALPDARAAVPR